MFTLENTVGFTAADLELLNAAVAVLMERDELLDEKNASAIVNNNWQGDGLDTIESLATR